MERMYKRLAIYLSLLIMCGSVALAVNKTFSGTGNFSNAALWGGSLPGAGDNLKIDGACTFDNAAANLAYGNLTLGGGVAGTVVWPVGGTNTLNVNNVTSTVTGGLIDMTNGGTIQVRGSWKTNLMSFTAGSGTIVWDVVGSSTLPTAITSYNNLTIGSGATVSASANFAILGTMAIQSGGTLSPAAFTVVNASGAKGTITGTGTVVVTRTASTADYLSQYKFSSNNLSGLTITYSGVSAQIVSGIAYGNLTINNASGVALGGNVSVGGVLTLTAGVVTTGGYGISVTNPTAVAEVITAGSITGQIQRSVGALDAGTYLFSDANTFLAPDGTQGALTVSLSSFPGTDAPGDPTQFAIKRYYTISPSGPLTATVRLSYAASEVRAGQNESNFTLWHHDGITWNDQGAVLRDTVNDWVEQVGISSFSPWTIAESGSPLPITLASFAGFATAGGGVRLQWGTVSEVNNYGFEIQRSPQQNGSYQTVSTLVPGHGTTNQPQQYSWSEVSVSAGTWYYRLKQIDLDHTEHLSEAIQVVVAAAPTESAPGRFALMQNYPNPFNPSTEIRFTVDAPGRTTLKVFAITGQEVATLFDDIAQPGQFYSAKLDGTHLATGIYIYKIQTGNRSDVKRMVLLK